MPNDGPVNLSYRDGRAKSPLPLRVSRRQLLLSGVAGAIGASLSSHAIASDAARVPRGIYVERYERATTRRTPTEFDGMGWGLVGDMAITFEKPLGVYRIDPQTKRPDRVVRSDDLVSGSAQLSPDRRYLGFRTHAGALHIRDLVCGKETTRGDRRRPVQDFSWSFDNAHLFSMVSDLNGTYFSRKSFPAFAFGLLLLVFVGACRVSVAASSREARSGQVGYRLHDTQSTLAVARTSWQSDPSTYSLEMS